MLFQYYKGHSLKLFKEWSLIKNHSQHLNSVGVQVKKTPSAFYTTHCRNAKQGLDCQVYLLECCIDRCTITLWNEVNLKNKKLYEWSERKSTSRQKGLVQIHKLLVSEVNFSLWGRPCTVNLWQIYPIHSALHVCLHTKQLLNTGRAGGSLVLLIQYCLTCSCAELQTIIYTCSRQTVQREITEISLYGMIFISNQNPSTKFIKKVLIKTYLLYIFLTAQHISLYILHIMWFLMNKEWPAEWCQSVLTILTFSFQPMPGFFTFADNTE